MITEIEQAALTVIYTGLTGVRAIAAQKKTSGIYTGPSVSVAIFDGTFERLTQQRYKQQATLNILLTLKNMQGEEARRKGVNPLVEGVVGLLLLNNLGLEIEPLRPLRWREVTDDEEDKEGKIVYLIQFSTSFIIEQQPAETVTDLLRVGLNYYLQPGDAVADAADEVTLA